MQKMHAKLSQFFPISKRDLLITITIFAFATGICILLQQAQTVSGFASPVFILAVLLVSRFTTGYLYGLVASILGVVCVNFIFTFPYWQVDFTLTGYPLTTLVFLFASVMTCTLATQVRQQDQLRAENEKEKMRANLLRSVSHDIRTPLTSIMGAASAVRENPDLPLEERQELLGDIHDEAHWLIRVVENLLSITRMENGRAKITKEQEAAEEVLSGVVQKFRRRYSNVTVSVTVPDELLMVPMDAILIDQVLFNLLENAVLHGETTTKIRLSVEKDGEYARFRVADNGHGFDPKDLPVLFDGTLTHNENENSDGKRNMGLGLSVCHAIVQAHGGTMAAGNLEQGAELTFRLPLAEEEKREYSR